MKRRRPKQKELPQTQDPPSSTVQSRTVDKSRGLAPLWPGSMVTVVALCGLSYYNILENEFSFDDNFAVVKNPDVTQGATLPVLFSHDFWGRDILDSLSHKSWRPLTTLTFRWNFMLAGLEVESYHAVNLALHTANTLVLLVFAHRISGGIGGGGLLGCGTITASLFAVHPVQ